MKNHKRIIFGAAAVIVAVLAVGGACATTPTASIRHRWRDACQSSVADLGKETKDYKALLGADATTAAPKVDAKSVKDTKTHENLAKAVKSRDADAIAKAEREAAKQAADQQAAQRSYTPAYSTGSGSGYSHAGSSGGSGIHSVGIGIGSRADCDADAACRVEATAPIER